MCTRLIALAVFALIGVTAFCPGPVREVRPGKGGRGGDVLAARPQGTWKIADKQRRGPNGEVMKYSTSQRIVIEKETWQFTSRPAACGVGGPWRGMGKARAGRGASYKIVLDAHRRPVEFRLKRTTTTGTPITWSASSTPAATR